MVARLVRFYPARPLTDRELLLLSYVQEIIEAEELLEQYTHKGELSPNMAYYLISTATGDLAEARRAKMTIMLNNMPPL